MQSETALTGGARAGTGTGTGAAPAVPAPMSRRRPDADPDSAAPAPTDTVAPTPTAGTDRAEGEWIARTLDLAPLPGEGGLFRRTYADEHGSVIYFLLIAPDFSALHVLPAAETYHWYAGAPLHLLLLHPDGRVERPVLGPDLGAGQRPQLVVPPGVWQGSSPLGAWSLTGTTMAPPFEYSGLVLGRRAELTDGWPDAADRIAALSRG